MPRLHPIAALRELTAGPRLVLAAAVGGAVFLLLPQSLRLPPRIAMGWVAGVMVLLGLLALAIGDASPERVRRRAQVQDERIWVIRVLIVAAAAVSLLALGFMLRKEEGIGAAELALRVVVAGAAVVASWALTHTIFALHYAHSFYGDGSEDGRGHRGGLAFPSEPAPDYWDFFYFSFVVGMTCQVSDVQVTSRPMRRLTLVHGVLSFFFNAVILALAVNFMASAL